MKKGVVLFSGGLDSTTTLYWAKAKGYKVHCLTFSYGQRHNREVNSARKIAKIAKCGCQVIKIVLPWKGSSLLDKRVPIPKGLDKAKTKPKRIPSTYVPARNTIFISFALSYAETIGADSIFIGANAIDFSGYPDCRPNYFKSFNKLIDVAIRKPVGGRKLKIYAPLIAKTKSQIIKEASKLGVPFELTWSCYKGGKKPCGVCDSCVLRRKGFESLNMEDPSYD